MAKHEVVVVTGASAGVGRAIVREFAKHGASIGLIARNGEALEHAKQEVEQLGGRALVLVADVADAEAVEQAAERVEQELGPIDIWINNAMASMVAPALEMTSEEFKRVTDVTYHGYVHGTLAALRRMKQRNAGTIVQVGSALAYRSIPLQSAYCGAKHGMKGFTEALRCEILHDRLNVRLNMVQLPAVNTPQFEWIRSRMPNHPQPVPPIYQPEIIARAVYWSAHHDRREMLVGISTVKAIWANKFIPGLIDRYLARTGYQSQQMEEPVAPDRQDNLMQYVPVDHGAHGRFDQQAVEFSPQAYLDRHRGKIMGASAVAALLAYAYYRVMSAPEERNELSGQVTH
jgi:NAD(P)-dependent dehydrogenase (short-subunit alcohol dehydrogenase family)